jgi:hypothetical protein
MKEFFSPKRNINEYFWLLVIFIFNDFLVSFQHNNSFMEKRRRIEEG